MPEPTEMSRASEILNDVEPTVTPSTESPAGGTPPPASGPDWDKFADTLGNKLGEHLGKVSAKPEPQRMTPEEARKALNVWEPGDDWYAKYDNLEQRKEAIAAMRDGMFKQNATYFQALLEHKLKELEERFHGEYRPIAERFSQHEARQQTERFHTAYPALKDEALKPIVEAVGLHLINNKLADGKSEAEAFKMLAEGVQAIVRKHNPAFTLSGSPSGAPAKPKTSTNPNAIRATSSGGGGGGGNGTAAGSTGNRALDILSGKVSV